MIGKKKIIKNFKGPRSILAQSLTSIWLASIYSRLPIALDSMNFLVKPQNLLWTSSSISGRALPVATTFTNIHGIVFLDFIWPRDTVATLFIELGFHYYEIIEYDLYFKQNRLDIAIKSVTFSFVALSIDIAFITTWEWSRTVALNILPYGQICGKAASYISQAMHAAYKTTQENNNKSAIFYQVEHNNKILSD
ncbi:hypothetical protein ACJX0J_039867 [Zea mays]